MRTLGEDFNREDFCHFCSVPKGTMHRSGCIEFDPYCKNCVEEIIKKHPNDYVNIRWNAKLVPLADDPYDNIWICPICGTKYRIVEEVSGKDTDNRS